MRKKCTLILYTTLICLIPLLGFADPFNPKLWEPLRSNFYFNKKVITKEPGILLVWTAQTINEQDRNKRIEEIRHYAPEKAGKYKDYARESILWEIDCKNRQLRPEEFIEFDAADLVIERYRYQNGPWDAVIPGTGGDVLYRKACLPPAPPVKKKKKR